MTWDQITSIQDHTTDIIVVTRVMDTGMKTVCRHRPIVRLGRVKGRLTIVAIITRNIPVEIVEIHRITRTKRNPISKTTLPVRGTRAMDIQTRVRGKREQKHSRGLALARTEVTPHDLCGRGVTVDRGVGREVGAEVRTHGVVCRGATIGRGDHSAARTLKAIGKVGIRRIHRALGAHSNTQDYVSKIYPGGRAVGIFCCLFCNIHIVDTYHTIELLNFNTAN